MPLFGLVQARPWFRSSMWISSVAGISKVLCTSEVASATRMYLSKIVGLIYLLPFIALNVAYLSEMSSCFNIARIAVVIILFFVMEPPNSIAAILLGLGH